MSIKKCANKLHRGNVMDLLSIRLRELKVEKDYSQQQVADLLEIKLRQYQNYESRENKPRYDTLIKLTNEYNVSLDYITKKSNYRSIIN